MLDLRELQSPDVNLYAWKPASHSEVYVCLDMLIGWDDEEGTNIFNVMLVTPEGLRAHGDEFVLSESRTLVVSEFDLEKVSAAINRILKKCSMLDYEDSCEKLQRYFHWEYEDFR